LKFIAENWHLLLMALTSGGLLLWPLVRQGAGGAGAVGTAEAVRLINREKGVLVDVSEPNEFAASHAAGARNVPVGQVEGSKDIPSNKQLPILLLCPTGARAGRAAALLRKAGYEKAVAVAGGTKAWGEAQLPLAKAEDKADTKSA
jgi:rhodanese-related sulfurtransferase